MDPDAIPMLLTLAGLACGVLWFVYGFLTANWFVAGPNIAGIVLSAIQLLGAAYIIIRVRNDPTVRRKLVETASDSEGSSLGTVATLSGDHDAAGPAGGPGAYSFGGLAQAVSSASGDRRGSGGAYASLEADDDDGHGSTHLRKGGHGRLGETGDVEVGHLGRNGDGGRGTSGR